MSKDKGAGEEGKQHLGGQRAPARAAFQAHSSWSFSCKGVIPVEAFCRVEDEYKQHCKANKKSNFRTFSIIELYFPKAFSQGARGEHMQNLQRLMWSGECMCGSDVQAVIYGTGFWDRGRQSLPVASGLLAWFLCRYGAAWRVGSCEHGKQSLRQSWCRCGRPPTGFFCCQTTLNSTTLKK